MTATAICLPFAAAPMGLQPTTGGPTGSTCPGGGEGCGGTGGGGGCTGRKGGLPDSRDPSIRSFSGSLQDGPLPWPCPGIVTEAPDPE